MTVVYIKDYQKKQSEKQAAYEVACVVLQLNNPGSAFILKQKIREWYSIYSEIQKSA